MGSGKPRCVMAPYGAGIDSAGTGISLRYRWTGRELDVETGLYFLRNRYLDPSSHRFVQEDPIGHAGGSHLYTYVGGKVLEARDPYGLSMEWVCDAYLNITWTWVAFFGYVATDAWISYENCRMIETKNPEGGGGGSGASGSATSPSKSQRPAPQDTCPPLLSETPVTQAIDSSWNLGMLTKQENMVWIMAPNTIGSVSITQLWPRNCRVPPEYCGARIECAPTPGGALASIHPHLFSGASSCPGVPGVWDPNISPNDIAADSGAGAMTIVVRPDSILWQRGAMDTQHSCPRKSTP